MDWDKLRIFHAVAEKGSLTHAGDVLHLSQSAVSRQIRALEESLAAETIELIHHHLLELHREPGSNVLRILMPDRRAAVGLQARDKAGLRPSGRNPEQGGEPSAFQYLR